MRIKNLFSFSLRYWEIRIFFFSYFVFTFYLLQAHLCPNLLPLISIERDAAQVIDLYQSLTQVATGARCGAKKKARYIINLSICQKTQFPHIIQTLSNAHSTLYHAIPLIYKDISLFLLLPAKHTPLLQKK